jgi:hypothetical protein
MSVGDRSGPRGAGDPGYGGVTGGGGRGHRIEMV